MKTKLDPAWLMWLPFVLAAPFALIYGPQLSYAAEKTSVSATTYQLLRSGSPQATFSSPAECDAALIALRALDAPTKTTGTTRYVCREDRSTTVVYQATPACPGYDNLPRTRAGTCPSGFTGSWTQTASFAQAAPPDCTVTTTWLPASAPDGSCAAIVNGTATLTWTPPSRNTDGSALTNLAGYRIYYGVSASALAQTVQIQNIALTSYTVDKLAAGTWYFSMRAYSANGVESLESNVVSKRVQ